MAEALFYKKNGIKGSVFFSQFDENYVKVEINLVNVPEGYHGIHVHEKPVKLLKKSKYCCEEAGSHFNGPMKKWGDKGNTGTPHGSYNHNTDRHVGDLCNNIYADEYGEVEFSYLDSLISLIPEHPHCIVGRSIVIHEDRDDEGLLQFQQPIEYRNRVNEYISLIHVFPTAQDIKQSLLTGNAGKRIAGANIEYIG